MASAYKTVDAAALGGFKKIINEKRDYGQFEYGFLVISFPRKIIRQLGHEGFEDTETAYTYTEPKTDRSTDAIEISIPPALALTARAFCHNHPVYGNYSTTDANSFKKLKDLTQQHRLKFDIVFYLLQADGQVRRSNSIDRFWDGELIDGLDTAVP